MKSELIYALGILAFMVSTIMREICIEKRIHNIEASQALTIEELNLQNEHLEALYKYAHNIDYEVGVLTSERIK